MQRTIFMLLIAGALVACGQQDTTDTEAVVDAQPATELDPNNPFFQVYETPFGVPPFDSIKIEHYMPAFEEGLAQVYAEIDAVAGEPDAPTFENTIEGIEEAGELVNKVANVFYNLLSAETNDDLQAIAREIQPKLTAAFSEIFMRDDLFARVDAVYQQRDQLNLRPDQQKLLEDQWKSFTRNGVNLDPDKKEEMKAINEELSTLSLQFGENLLKENQAYTLLIEDETDLAGLPEGVIAQAAELAKQKEEEGKWAFNLNRTSIEPFLQYADNRDLRKDIYIAYTLRGNNDNELDNKKVAAKMAALRARRAALLGYETHAHYILEENMAKTPERVYQLLDQLWAPALERAQGELDAMQELVDAQGGDFKVEAWDWRYYAEKVRQARYAFDEAEVKPYFSLDSVLNGAFMVAKNLYGVTFEERFDIPTYQEDVRTFEVKEADGTHLGVFLLDFYPREGKRGGAWMNTYREQSNVDGVMTSPIVVNVSSYTPPAGDSPALLRFSEVETLFHEFGHGLHGLMSNVIYESQSGTNVPRDYVEFPSQILENWAGDPEVMKTYAFHYETGEVIPDALIEKMKAANKFNGGFRSVEYLAACLLDLNWHTLRDSVERDTLKFEAEAMEEMGIMPEIASRYRSTYFAHIFAGGYSSGYYSYIWSQVLDADGFEAFKEVGLYDQELAAALRNALARGGSEDPMDLYVKFRGREPSVQPLLKKLGFLDEEAEEAAGGSATGATR